MAELNKKAAQIMPKYPVSACTDITGFGLLGHLAEMTEASGCGCAFSRADSAPARSAALCFHGHPAGRGPA